MVWERYDHMLFLNTTVLPGSDAAVLRLKGTRKGLAICLDGNGRYGYLDPRMGGMIAVAEAARNVVCSGARPLAITNCLNFGNPENPEIMWQFAEAVEGMAEACRLLEVPVTGGNVSFYNETSGRRSCPPPLWGWWDCWTTSGSTTQWFKEAGDIVLLLGETRDELGGSEYLKVVHGLETGRCPRLDLDRGGQAVPCRRLGEVGGEALALGGKGFAFSLPIRTVRSTWATGLSRMFGVAPNGAGGEARGAADVGRAAEIT